MKFGGYYKLTLLKIQDFLATKYYLWWLHLLLTSHKLNREYLIACNMDFPYGGRDREVFVFICLCNQNLISVRLYSFFPE